MGPGPPRPRSQEMGSGCLEVMSLSVECSWPKPTRGKLRGCVMPVTVSTDTTADFWLLLNSGTDARTLV